MESDRLDDTDLIVFLLSLTSYHVCFIFNDFAMHCSVFPDCLITLRPEFQRNVWSEKIGHGVGSRPNRPQSWFQTEYKSCRSAEEARSGARHARRHRLHPAHVATRGTEAE